MSKKIIAALGTAMILISAFASCTAAPDEKNDTIDVVCTIFPCYDWTKQVVGDASDVNITYLLENGSDLHNFQPTADDMIKISNCDVFVYVGGESDEWVDEALENARNKNMKVVKLIDAVAENVVEEELKDGMEAEDEHDESEISPEYDEHIWLSLNNAQRCVSAITDGLCEADDKNSAIYRDNSNLYNTELQLLDRSFHTLLDEKKPVLIFGDRFPFRYFTDDYALDYYAAFSGCSADTEASFETIIFLAQKADDLNAEYIFAIENSDCTIADAIIQNTANKSQKIAILDSAQSISYRQISEGESYLGIMKKNYEILEEAFK